MTIRKLIELIDLVKSNLQTQGLTQRLNDYLVTIQNNQGNLVLLREIHDKLIMEIESVLSSEVPEALDKILLTNENRPFLKDDFLAQLVNLKSSNVADPPSLFNALNSIVSNLVTRVNQNISGIDGFRNTLTPFLTRDFSIYQKDDNGLLNIIFSNHSSYKDLKSLSFETGRWNKGLFLYQQIITDKTPSDFEIIEVDNGSIEFVINIDFKVVENLLELFKVGLEVYGAYLLYKSNLLEIIKTYRGNEKLIKSEEEREKLLLDNIKEAIKTEIQKQVKKANQKNKEAIDKKIDQVTQLVTDHIVKGNNVKLISAPESQKEVIFKEEQIKETQFISNKKNYDKLDEGTKQKLISEFTQQPDKDDK